MPIPAEDNPFLRSILAAYSDDGPRLLYADYLAESPDEADQARAEFIRLQLALARLSDVHPRRKELTTRQNNLLGRYHDAWTAHLHKLAAGFQFRRGILDAVTVDAGTFLVTGEELFRRAPIRRVRFSEVGRHIAKLAGSPLLDRIRELDLCGNDLGNYGANVLFRSPHLQRIEVLDLSHNGLDDTGVQVLSETISLPRLRNLGLHGNPNIGDPGIAALACSANFEGLHALDISGTDLGGAGLASIAESEHLKSLHTLIFHGNPVGDEGLAALASSDLLSRMLKHEPRLDLQRNLIGPAGVEALVRSRRILPVVSIDLSGNSLGDGGVCALASSSLLPRLRRLVLKHNWIGDMGAIALARSTLMEKLTYLNISDNVITQSGIDALFNHRKGIASTIEFEGNFSGVSPV